MIRRNPIFVVFAIVLSLLYGIIASGQLLGFIRLYKPILAIPLGLGLAVIVFLIYTRNSIQFMDTFEYKSEINKNIWLAVAFTFGGLLIYILLVYIPLVHWPYSPITLELPWDAGLYHFPKAAEMISTTSAWDLSIAYGEYPFGYESLIAFSLLFNHSGFLIGTVHALISLFLFLGMSLLIYQRTKLPKAPILLLLSILFIGYQLARNFDSNIWWIFWPQITLIGKNDVIIAAALLAVILHIPSSQRDPIFPLGLAISTMIALSSKPNAALVIVFAWLVLLFFLWRSKQLKSSLKQLLWRGLLILPGCLWMVRNLVAQGKLFSIETMHLSQWSITSNLTNPYFYKYIPQHLYIVMAIIVLAAIVSVFRRSMRFDVITALVLFLTFALTPASAFFGSTTERAQIEWRFAIALLASILLLLLLIFEPVILPFYQWIAKRKYISLPVALAILIFVGWCTWSQRDLLSTFPQNAIVLHDQYRQSVGVDGYYSAYDFVQKNVRNSVVIIENGLPYYLYDPGFTNSVTRSRPADYIVYLQTAWINEGGYSEMLNQPEWNDTWQLVYEDSEGRVYKRRHL